MRERHCTNRMNVRQAMTMAKRTASQYDGRFEDELGTKRPQDFLAVFFNETGAENQGRIQNFNQKGAHLKFI